MNWQEHNFFDGMLIIDLPEQMITMPEEMKKKRYPSPNPPQIIKINQETMTTLTLSRCAVVLDEPDILEIITAMMWAITHVHPRSIISKANKLENKDGVIGWFSYQTDSLINDKNFHISYAFMMGKYLVMGAVVSPLVMRKGTEAIFKDIMDTVRIIKKSDLQIAQERVRR
ncbi:MAG: hypothetical protein LBV33_08530 [Lachnospiraceae bacterium]|nr:hypothetical protein [Lachnospiraceae bacterium]